jgi:Mobilization protein NikA
MTQTTRPHRTVIRPTRFTPEEWALLVRRARECGLAPSTYMREVSLGAVPRARPGVVSREAVYQLSRIGNNLNQLARAANALRRVELSRRLEQVLGELRAALRELVG